MEQTMTTKGRRKGMSFPLELPPAFKRKEVHTQPDALLHDGISDFDRRVILECRESGMTDEEIKKWLREI